MNLEKSEKLHQRALKSLVGGVNSPVRSFKRVGGKPILVKSARGACIEDVDGKEYLDLVMSYGPHLFGHAHPYIVEAVQGAVRHSSCYGMTAEREIVWAEKLLAKFPYFGKVRAMNSGTEACATAIRLARGFTGRDKVLKFSGHYHGHVDSLMVAAGSGLATLATAGETVPDSGGIPKALSDLAVVAEFNNLEQLEKVFQRHGQELACVILEPIMGNMGVVKPDPKFLQELRQLTRAYESVLIFDEVMTGFRVHEQSAQGLYNIEPDLATFGKIVGGGMPLAALAGTDRIMAHLAPMGSVYQAGTLSGNPVCIEAGIAMMELIRQRDPYAQLEEFGQKFEDTLRNEISLSRTPFYVNRVGSMISVFARDSEPKNDTDTTEIDEKLFNKYFWAMLEEGFMLPPSPFEAYFLSIPLSEIPEDEWKTKIRNAFRKLR
ncbi:aminotransferase class III-fold pyridoxal phosphate-dependent enzyme [bacterium]|nr:aminotransferase class III-fold pyridoxal phosphate-dependent enzyme [bacterium]